jgi:hypothetical protein
MGFLDDVGSWVELWALCSKTERHSKQFDSCCCCSPGGWWLVNPAFWKSLLHAARAYMIARGRYACNLQARDSSRAVQQITASAPRNSQRCQPKEVILGMLDALHTQKSSAVC